MDFKPYRSIVGYIAVISISFTLALITRSAGDLSLYTGSQILKAQLILALLGIGLYYRFNNYHQLPQRFYYCLAVNGAALPLLLLSRYPYAISLSFISASFAILIIGARAVLPLALIRLKTFRETKPTPTLIVNPIKKPLPPTTIAINGIDTALGEQLLPQLLGHHNVKQLILFGRQLSLLESWRYWLRENHPEVTVVTALTDHLNAISLASIFESYRPELVFDIDRLFFSAKSEGAIAAVATTNLYWPRLLIEQAIKVKAKAVITLTPQAHNPDDLIQNCQLVHECFAQKMDGATTRVIPLRCSPISEDQTTLHFLTKFLKKQEGKEIVVSEAKTVAHLIQAVLTQLLANPAHHGSVWVVTTVKKLLSTRIAELNSKHLVLNQFYKLVNELVNSLKAVTHCDPDWLSLSLADVAIVNDCPIIEFDDYFVDLEKALDDHNELEVSNILKVA